MKISFLQIRVSLFLAMFLFSVNALSVIYRPGPGVDPGTGNVANLIADIGAANASATDDIIDLEGRVFTLNNVCSGCPGTGLPIIQNAGGRLSIINGAIVRSLATVNAFGLINNQGELDLFNITLKNGSVIGNASGGAINNSNSLIMENCIVANNQSANVGGGILNSGTLSLHNSIVSGNTAAFSGGGIYNNLENENILTIDSSTLSNNIANDSGDGGGLYSTGGLAIITNSTISSNQASRGGGIFLSSGVIDSISNSTIANNVTLTNGGGIYNNTSASIGSLRNSTISGNTGAGLGQGIYNLGTFVSVFSNIIAGNGTAASFNIYNTAPGVFPSSAANEGYNLVGSTSGTSIANGVNNDIVVAFNQVFLGPLQNNGGPTYTMALLPNNFGINNGLNPANLHFDQRGDPRSRVVCGRPDIGAYELQLCQGK